MEHEQDPSQPPQAPSGGPENPSGTGILLAPGVRVRDDAIKINFVRSSGPGGQNVNKRSTKAQLRIAVDDIPLDERPRARFIRLCRSAITNAGELIIESDQTRSQGRNKDACMAKLKEIIQRALVEPKLRKATKPTKGSIRRRIEAKKQRAQTKQRRKPPEHP